MQKKRFIFDLDGTILNTWQDLASAMNTALAEKGLPVFLPENYRLWVGSGILRLAKYLLEVEVPKALHLQELDSSFHVTATELVSGFMRAYDACCLEKSLPYPGVLDFLNDLKRSGQDLAVLTNKPDVFAQRLVAHFFPNVFDVVVGMRETCQPKPDLSLWHILESSFLVPALSTPVSTVMIGDSEADVYMGKNTASKTIAVTWGYRSAKTLQEVKPDFLVNDVKTLAKTCFALLDEDEN